MVSTDVRWQITGDYFENCSCDVVCPCLFSPAPALTSQPSSGSCEVPLAFHIDRGSYGNVALDGLNAVEIWRAPGPMANGNISVALYIDERASDEQRDAMQAIFSGAAGGPIGALAPLVGEFLGVKSVPIQFQAEGKHRSAQIPGIMDLRVSALPRLGSDEEIWVAAGHPFSPDKLALAVGDDGSTFADYGMRWDNSGKNGHYASISWSNG